MEIISKRMLILAYGCILVLNYALAGSMEPKAPAFRVLVVKGYVHTIKSPDSLKIGDYMHLRDVIVIAEQAFLSLVHKSGETFTYHGKTTVVISSIKVKNDKDDIFLDVERLISKKLPEKPKIIGHDIGATEELYIYYPLGRIWQGSKICIKWLDKERKPGISYTITVTNLANDTLLVRNTSERQYFFDVDSILRKDKILSDMLVLSFARKGTKILASDYFVDISVGPQKVYGCNPTDPAVNLVLGLILEQNFAFKQAVYYYNNAVKYSGYERIYAEIRANFVSRARQITPD